MSRERYVFCFDLSNFSKRRFFFRQVLKKTFKARRVSLYKNLHMVSEIFHVSEQPMSFCKLIYEGTKTNTLHSTGHMEKPCFVLHMKLGLIFVPLK